MLVGEIRKDRVVLEKFIAFLKTRKLDPVIVSQFNDTLSLGIYMDFLEQEYNIGVSADNASYTLYYIPVDEGTKHYNDFVDKYKKHGGIVFHTHSLPVCTTVIDRYIAGVAAALKHTILPF